MLAFWKSWSIWKVLFKWFSGLPLAPQLVPSLLHSTRASLFNSWARAEFELCVGAASYLQHQRTLDNFRLSNYGEVWKHRMWKVHERTNFLCRSFVSRLFYKRGTTYLLQVRLPLCAHPLPPSPPHSIGLDQFSVVQPTLPSIHAHPKWPPLTSWLESLIAMHWTD